MSDNFKPHTGTTRPTDYNPKGRVKFKNGKISPAGLDSWFWGYGYDYGIIAYEALPPVLDLTRPLQTRDGRKARLLATDLKGPFPLLAALDYGSHEGFRIYYSDGRLSSMHTSEYDLINVPELHPDLRGPCTRFFSFDDSYRNLGAAKGINLDLPVLEVQIHDGVLTHAKVHQP
jgi:hypothetical protein